MGQCLARQVLQLVRALQVCEKRPWHCCPWVVADFSDRETSQLTRRKSSRTGPASIAVKGRGKSEWQEGGSTWLELQACGVGWCLASEG